MPAPKLVSYGLNVYGASTQTVVVPAVPAGRALVISKITITPAPGVSSQTFRLVLNGRWAALDVVINLGEVYTETGLVVPSGSTLEFSSSVANGCHVIVFGQEVDN